MCVHVWGGGADRLAYLSLMVRTHDKVAEYGIEVREHVESYWDMREMTIESHWPGQ